VAPAEPLNREDVRALRVLIGRASTNALPQGVSDARVKRLSHGGWLLQESTEGGERIFCLTDRARAFLSHGIRQRRVRWYYALAAMLSCAGGPTACGGATFGDLVAAGDAAAGSDSDAGEQSAEGGADVAASVDGDAAAHLDALADVAGETAVDAGDELPAASSECCALPDGQPASCETGQWFCDGDAAPCTTSCPIGASCRYVAGATGLATWGHVILCP
jgi:hypothetical protein